VTVSDRVVVALDSGPSVAGHVFNAKGEGYDGLEVVARGPAYRTGKTDATGAYKITGLPPGKYRVLVSLDLRRTERVPFDFSAFQERELEVSTKSLEIDFKPRGGKAKLSVLGLPRIPPVRSYLVVGAVPPPKDIAALDALIGTAIRSEGYGESRFTLLLPGPHTLLVVARTSDGAKLLTREVVVTNDAEQSVTIDFDAAVQVR
jgi:hypothetical protein